MKNSNNVTENELLEQLLFSVNISLFCTLFPETYESELCGGAVTVSFWKYLPWQAMQFLKRSNHFSKT
jgi:hypothetical protein